MGRRANELRLSLRMRLDGLVLSWLGRATSGGTVLSSSYMVNTKYCINTAYALDAQ